MNKPFWEDAYKDYNTNAFGKPSPEIIDLSNRLPKCYKVLDIGCGEGRNAIFLASKGFAVDAFDISQAGIDKLTILAKQNNIKINAWVQDISNYKFLNKYDFIIAHGVLHLIEKNIRNNLIIDIKEHTSNNGVNVIAIFTNTIPAPLDLADIMIGLFDDNEIKTFYDDWKIDLYENYIFEDEHPGEIKHRHPLNKIVAFRQ